ncbi:thioredoxin [Microvirga tunisiensis]|uniref:Thioredoxin n=2 Tax=Pannonibacter tanglangensis TaxID=2750084 RepID=A0ABW9ZLU7_9HYPH|nr:MULTISPECIES: thioredoxin [unclassified Pannonibacter]NBN65855.1 thioredoxin [Pannonibacter sp. XCT-34]NBN80373.1 thioredoxin [Pannonibacter sp. XCT-53]
MSTGSYSMGGQVGGGFGGSFGGGGFGGGGARPAQTPAAGGDDLIKDVSTASFARDVLEASRQQPVLVDFWAPWCGPCRQLTPIIEAAVRAAKGKVKLAKMNIDDHPEVAGQLGIQSIPAVIAFKNGQPVDGFMGAQPESQVKAFIDRLGGPAAPGGPEDLLTEGETLLEAKDFGHAAQMFAAVLQMEPENARALAGLSRCYLGAGDLERARQALDMVPEAGRKEAAYAAAQAALTLAEQAEALGDLAELEARIAADPADHQARFDLALGLNARGNHQAAVDHLIEIVRRGRDWNEDAARKQLLQFFEAWGPKEPATNYGRRKLSSVLFS